MDHACRLLLIDDSDDFLDGLTDWLEDSPRIHVIGRAHSRREALIRIDALRPDLVVLAATLPDGSGFELTRELKAAATDPLVVLMSFHDEDAIPAEARAAGADAWISKTNGFHHLAAEVDSLFRARLDRAGSSTTTGPKGATP